MIENIVVDGIINNALAEDLGWGDVTTDLTIPEATVMEGNFIAKEDGIICGIDICRRVFEIADKNIEFRAFMKDGQRVFKGNIIAAIRGNARSILKCERTALNFFQRMSGIATMTDKFVSLTSDLDVKVVDTRKTVPGLRVLDKYSVKVGGGFNHRFNLSDMILIKDNHIKAAGGINPAVAAARKNSSHALKIEVEVESIKELIEAIDAGADIVMLDNMTLNMMREAVSIAGGKVLLEASGNVSLEGERNIRDIAETGVNIISVGSLTNSSDSLDISLKFL
ncbi:MAG TPA: carboxylating nicotinate-nucleotide diphosphorylase [Bacillota bacterium]|nr:carboxylating nicotinate-nucleotide diphosphorylase [Bacillota bacterium]HOR85109.1 carboxylating nicotinate-nucleotide diphosphorylase [Bacillota bacterium]HPL54405.1 carboxylating nicotinate-nucleotide diphosphorylase [Bacillota bacterium]